MLPSLAPQIATPVQIGAVPRCPNTQSDISHEVRTYAGAGGERRTYNCTCGMTWNQKRPDRLAPGEDPDVRQSNRAALGGAKRSSREYKCGNCGEPKKGHVCTVGDGDVKRARTSSSPPVVVVPSPPPPMRCEQYDDMLKFTAPPTDAELLAFLRKYDLRPSEATDLYNSMRSYQQALNAEDIAVAMTQIAGEPVEEDTTAHAIAIAEAVGPPAEPPGELLFDELLDLSLEACADCGDEMVGDDRKACNCGRTVVHRFCLKLCEHCG